VSVSRFVQGSGGGGGQGLPSVTQNVSGRGGGDVIRRCFISQRQMMNVSDRGLIIILSIIWTQLYHRMILNCHMLFTSLTHQHSPSN
jgi:hypothetical protein